MLDLQRKMAAASRRAAIPLFAPPVSPAG